MKKLPLFLLLFSLLLSLVGCATKVPPEALRLPPESLANRQIQTRIFETGNENEVLVAANAVLQDLGFNLDETSVELGVVVASKNRDATDEGEVFLLTLLGIFGNNPNAVNAADAVQLVKASLVVRGLGSDGDAAAPAELSPERIRQLRDKVYAVMVDNLSDKFSKEDCARVAESIADKTADTLVDDLDKLLAVQDAPGTTAVRVTFQRVIYNVGGQINTQEQINDVTIYQEFFDKLSKSLFLEANQI